MATMLSLIQQARSELGLSSPASVAGNTQQDVIQTLALLNAVGYEVQREHEWQGLTVSYQFSTVVYSYTADTTSGSTTISTLSDVTGLTTAPTYFQVSGTGIPNDTRLVSVDSGAMTAVLSNAATATGTTVTLTLAQTMYAFPSDFDRLVDRTEWDKTQHWEMPGPMNAQQWQWLRSGYIATGPRVRFRRLGNLFQIWPGLTTAHTLGFEYVSNLYVTATGESSPSKSSFTVDTDTCVFGDRLMVIGTKLKYFEAKGFDTTALYRDYHSQLDLAKAYDAGSRSLSFAPPVTDILIGEENVPDAGYGS